MKLTSVNKLKKTFLGLIAVCLALSCTAGPFDFTFPKAEEQQDFFRKFREMVVGTPAEIVDPAMTFDQEIQKDGYTQYLVSYNVEKEERVSAWLLVPDHKPGEKLPLVFCLHPTWREGKDVMINQWATPPKNDAELRTRNNRSYGVELVKHGFVCFAPDRYGYGARAPLPEEKNPVANMKAYEAEFAKRHPNWHRTFGKVPFDLSRALDALLKLDYIDGDNVGTIGHSLGGWDSLYFWGSDPRVKAAVPNSGGAHWVIKEAWLNHAWRMRFVAGEVKGFNPKSTDAVAPIYIMMGAPKPLLYMRALRDAGTDYASSVLERARMIRAYYNTFPGNPYQIHGKNQFAVFFHDENHDFPVFARELAYRWLKVQLMGK